jgi:hypothetical protein
MTRQRRIRRRSVNTPALTSNSAAASNPHGVSVGAGAAALTQLPSSSGRSHRCSGPVQGASQQTLSTQKPGVEHCAGVLHAPPMGTGVLVGVAVGVLVGVLVGVNDGVAVPFTHVPAQKPFGPNAL